MINRIKNIQTKKYLLFIIFVILLMFNNFLLTAQENQTIEEFGELYIFRPKIFVGSALVMQIEINGYPIVDLKNNSFTSLKIQKGQIVISAKAGPWINYYKINIESLTSYFIKPVYTMGWTKNTIEFVIMEKNEGLVQIEENKSDMIEPSEPVFFNSLSKIDPDTIDLEEMKKKDEELASRKFAYFLGIYGILRYDKISVNQTSVDISDIGVGLISDYSGDGYYMHSKLYFIFMDICTPEYIEFEDSNVDIEKTLWSLSAEQIFGFGMHTNSKSILLLGGIGVHILAELAMSENGEFTGSGLFLGIGATSTLNIKISNGFSIFIGADVAFDFFNLNTAIVAAAFDQDVTMTNIHTSINTGISWYF